VSSTPTSAGKDVDGMHSRPMFPILETQVGDGWVGDVDYTKQATKQDSNFLVDWVRVCQSEGQPVTRFDDLDGAESGAYRIAPASRTEGLTAVSNGDAAWQNKNNFYYGGQPRYETSRSHAVPLMQGRFALRLRGPQTLCRIRTNAFARSERPVAGKVVPSNRRNRAAP
jgi:hexosaminidase